MRKSGVITKVTIYYLSILLILMIVMSIALKITFTSYKKDIVYTAQVQYQTYLKKIVGQEYAQFLHDASEIHFTNGTFIHSSDEEVDAQDLILYLPTTKLNTLVTVIELFLNF